MKGYEALARATKTLLLNKPFYGLFLLGMKKTFSDKTKSASVEIKDIDLELLINEEYFLSITKEQRVGLLEHEVLHICLGHVEFYSHHNNTMASNVAMDLVINQLIKEENLPPKAVTINSIRKKFNVSLPSEKSTEFYYTELEKLVSDNKQNSNSKSEGIDPKDENNNSNIQIETHADHPWEDSKDMSESQITLIKNNIEKKLVEIEAEVLKSQGNIPGEMMGILSRLKKIPKKAFDWKGYIRKFVGKSVLTHSKSTYRKLNFRFEDNPGIKNVQMSKVLAAIDTSASVTDEELKRIVAELFHLKRTGHEIFILQFDTQINSIEKLGNVNSEFKVYGRGGTDFQPVIDHYNNSKKYNCLLVFTDGEAYSPENAPRNILWVHSHKSKINQNLPGLKIKIENE